MKKDTKKVTDTLELKDEKMIEMMRLVEKIKNIPDEDFEKLRDIMLIISLIKRGL